MLGWNIAVILWGAIVRATGSGAGCGNHWPLCNGEVIPHSPQVATLIEFTHRMMTGGATFTILVLLIWTFRATRHRHLARIAAVASTLLLINEAFLGALLVKLGYVVNNQSAGRFIVLPIHLANTLLLLAALALTAHFLSRESGFMRGSVETQYVAASLLGLAATIAVGVTGSLAALGDTLFPAASLHAAMAQEFPRAALGFFVCGGCIPLRASSPAHLSWPFYGQQEFIAVNRETTTWREPRAGLLLFQYVLGIVDVLLRAPTWMQIVHLLSADLLWVALIVLTARVAVVPLGCAGEACPLRLRESQAGAD